MSIFIVNGAPGSGKTTFEYFVDEAAYRYGYSVFIDSTINFVKQIAAICGWNGDKTPKNRKFLSDLKDLLTSWDDVPVKKIKQNLENYKSELRLSNLDFNHYGIIFIDSREPQEIERLCKELNAKSILIDRKDVDKNAVNSNHADSEVYNYKYDIVIDNNGTLSDLKKKAIAFIEKDLV